MQSEILLKRILSVIAFTELMLFLALIFYFIPEVTLQRGSIISNDNIITIKKEEKIIFGLPVRLEIPEINVDANINYVGLNSDGAMDISENQDDVAWFNLGPHPGENGSAVIAGHYGRKKWKPSVFDNLYKLREGDKLFIEDTQGIIATFVVREIRRYDPKADASDVFNSNDGKAHLNLITCEGSWDDVSQSYSLRLVVFTDKE